MEAIDIYIISACLCGVNCKYNGKNNFNHLCNKLFIEKKAILVCPEQLGGLSTPRVPSEIIKNKVITKNGVDVTLQFAKGANEVIDIVKKLNIKKAILKDGSPSCGVNYIYDGNFTNKKINGMGITAKALKELGVEILSENGCDDVICSKAF